MNDETMDHEQAVKNLTAERYLLGELSGSELDAYEQHLFECAFCFEQVQAGTEFVSYIKQSGAEAHAAVTQAGWRQFRSSALRPAPAIAFVACFLAAISVYQNMATIQKLKAPQIESRYMLTEQSRDSEKVVSAPRNSRVRLAIEFQPQGEFISYEARITSADGEVKVAVPFSIQASQDMIEVSLYAGSLKPGRYLMLVQGTDRNGSKQELARDPFRMQFQE
ncbi:MAG: zf-HC2 domain-containing protein [Candidatus Angelobacter sp.]